MSIRVKLTREQELKLIRMGLNQLLGHSVSKEVVEPKKHTWSKEQHRKFSETMKRKYGLKGNSK